MHELALFAGAGGGILGGHLLGWRTICAVEWDAYAASVLVARQNDGCLSPCPIWDDVQTFDGRPWRGRVDVISGGFPCQDISAAGKGAGIEGERSGMWKHMARIIGEVLPRFVYVENSPMLVGRGLAVVIADLAEMGYDAEWGIVGAHHAGAPHKRDRIWIVGNATSGHGERRELLVRPRQAQSRGAGGSSGICSTMANPASLHDGCRDTGTTQRQESESGESRRANDVADSMHSRPQGSERPGEAGAQGQPARHFVQCCCGSDVANTGSERGQLSTERELTAIEQPWSDSEARSSGGIAGEWWATEPDVGRVAHGVAARVDRLRCIGNGQVPAVAKLAWEILSKDKPFD
jgi:DNA (cytosine-5)-methyltransferase 1